jgi:hypothetical protein
MNMNQSKIRSLLASGALLLLMLAPVAYANTSSDTNRDITIGGPDTYSMDNDFCSGATDADGIRAMPATGDSSSCDADEAVVVQNSLFGQFTFDCESNPVNFETQCVGGFDAFADTAFGGGNFGVDSPIVSGASIKVALPGASAWGIVTCYVDYMSVNADGDYACTPSPSTADGWCTPSGGIFDVDVGGGGIADPPAGTYSIVEVFGFRRLESGPLATICGGVPAGQGAHEITVTFDYSDMDVDGDGAAADAWVNDPVDIGSGLCSIEWGISASTGNWGEVSGGFWVGEQERGTYGDGPTAGAAINEGSAQPGGINTVGYGDVVTVAVTKWAIDENPGSDSNVLWQDYATAAACEPNPCIPLDPQMCQCPFPFNNDEVWTLPPGPVDCDVTCPFLDADGATRDAPDCTLPCPFVTEPAMDLYDPLSGGLNLLCVPDLCPFFDENGETQQVPNCTVPCPYENQPDLIDLGDSDPIDESCLGDLCPFYDAAGETRNVPDCTLPCPWETEPAMDLYDPLNGGLNAACVPDLCPFLDENGEPRQVPNCTVPCVYENEPDLIDLADPDPIDESCLGDLCPFYDAAGETRNVPDCTVPCPFDATMDLYDPLNGGLNQACLDGLNALYPEPACVVALVANDGVALANVGLCLGPLGGSATCAHLLTPLDAAPSSVSIDCTSSNGCEPWVVNALAVGVGGTTQTSILCDAAVAASADSSSTGLNIDLQQGVKPTAAQYVCRVEFAVPASGPFVGVGVCIDSLL